MPQTRAEFVSKEEFKSLKGIPLSVTSRDGDIDLLLDAAVDELTRKTGKPLIDARRHQLVQPNPYNQYIYLHGYRITLVESIRYWLPNTNLGTAPAQFMAAGSFGELKGELSADFRWLVPPDDGWPDSEDDLFQVTTVHSMDSVGLDSASVASLKADAIELAWARFADTKGPNFDRYISNRVSAHQVYAA